MKHPRHGLARELPFRRGLGVPLDAGGGCLYLRHHGPSIGRA
jgi:hypothetical protein